MRSRSGASFRFVTIAVVSLLSFVAAVYFVRPAVEYIREVRQRDGYEQVETLSEELQAAAEESGLDIHFLAALAMRESSGRVDAVSRVDALGLFQLMLPTARERARGLGEEEPDRAALLSDAALSARLGADYLAYLVERFDGSEEAALVAYNVGPTKLSIWIRERGSYAAWRAEREAAGDSDLLAFAADVLHYREVFRERGLLALQ